jgi:hypothetical protein
MHYRTSWAAACRICKQFFLLTSICLLSGFIAVFAQNPVPVVYEPLLPAAVIPGSPGFTLTVHGTGFVPGAPLSLQVRN